MCETSRIEDLKDPCSNHGRPSFLFSTFLVDFIFGLYFTGFRLRFTVRLDQGQANSD